jgi:orotidine 5'-phosphate decarboxylase subfamily 2
MTITFHERFKQSVEVAGSLLCVGLDPYPDRTPHDQVLDKCRRVIEATAPFAAAYKPNSAFFEAAGTDGLEILAQVIAHVPPGKLVVLDAKRGDIDSTARAYAHAAFHVLKADAATVNAYLGSDSMEPWLADPTRGAFVVCHTSNPGARDLQERSLEGEPLYIAVARAAVGWNEAGPAGKRRNVGLVVGATYPQEMAAVRRAAPGLPFLIPGLGAQGGDAAAAVASGLDASSGGVLGSSSRGVFYADDPARAARELSEVLLRARDSALAAA